MKNAAAVLLISAVLFGIGFTMLPGALAEDAKCNENEPGCSLQRWMANHVQAALVKKDLESVGRALQTAAKSAPDPKWNEGDKGWSRIANAGVAAAKAGNLNGVKQACRSCHQTWRADYKKQYRSRLLFGDAAHGAEVFEQHCDMCHPGAGEGIGPSLLNRPASVSHIRKQVREGSGRMRSFSEDRLNQRDLDSVIAYILFRNGAN